MARTTYRPTREERALIREFILRNSGYSETGQLISDHKKDGALYPSGFTSFAKKAGISYRALSNVLNGDGPCTEMTWHRIQCEMDRNTAAFVDELIGSLARMTGKDAANIKTVLAAIA